MKANNQATLPLILLCLLSLIAPSLALAQVVDGGNSLVTAEAFLDDPATLAGTGTPLSLTADPELPWNEARDAVDLTEQEAGVHTIYVRFQDAYGDWSEPVGQSFFIPEGSLGDGNNVGGSNRIQTAEAFFDTDPGPGAGVPIAIPVDGAIDTSTEVLRGLVDLAPVTPGQHTLYWRFQDTAGVWSPPLGQSVTITPELIGSAGANRLIAAEYRIDAAPFQTTPVADGALGGIQEEVDRVFTVSSDYHTSRVRFQNSAGHWSTSEAPPPPNPNDTDNDGLDDAWERQWFGDLTQDGADDNDGDGLTNIEELQQGSDPLTPDDLATPTISGFLLDTGGARLSGIGVCIVGAVGHCDASTDGFGHYVIGTTAALGDGDYTITPQSAAWVFTPESRPVTISAASVGGIDFTAEVAPPPPIEPPVATIDSITPTDPTEGDLIAFVGSAGPADQDIDTLHWSAAKLTGGVPEADRLEIGSSPEFITDILPAGDWRIYLQVRNADGVWSLPATADISVQSGEGLSDPALQAWDISLRDQDGAQVLNPYQGDELMIRTRVRNLGLVSTPEEATVRVFEGDPADGNLVSQGTVAVIPAEGSVDLDLPWTVGYDSAGNRLPGFADGYHSLTVQVDFTANLGQPTPLVPEITRQNNQSTLAVLVGLVPAGLYGIDLGLYPPPGILYEGRSATLSGIANYSFGSLLPVMGAAVTIEFNGATYSTRTTSPSGMFAATVRLPSTPGTYVATVRISDNNLFAQETITLDVEPIPVSWPEQPPGSPAPPPPPPRPSKDLVIASLGVSGDGVYRMETGERAVVVGSEVTPYVSIQNVGNLATEAGFTLSFYDGPPDAGGQLIGTELVEDILAPYESISVSSSQAWLLDQVGGELMVVRIDEGNTVEEENEYNNERGAGVRVREYRPDFRPYSRNGSTKISGLRFSGTPLPGEPVTAYVDVYNNGPAPYGASVPILLSLNDPQLGSIELDTIETAGGIAVGGKATAALTIDTTGLEPGAYKFSAVVDAPDAIPEDLESNNATTRTLTVASPDPSLYPVYIDFSNHSPVIDGDLTIYATIQNKGRNPGGGIVSFYLGDPDSGGSFIDSVETEVLDGDGGQEVVSVDWVAPSVPGVYRIYAEIDDHKNYRNLTVTDVPRPDLQVYSEDIAHDPLAPLVDDEVSVWTIVRNVSPEVASAGFDVRFYIDSAAGIVQLGSTIHVDNLAAGGSIRVDADATLRAELPYYVILVDLIPNFAQGEGNFADNTATTSFGLYQPPEVTHSISGMLTDAQGFALSGVTVNLTGDATDSTTTSADGSYFFDVAQPGLYRVEPETPPSGDLYPKDAQGSTYRQVELIDPAQGVRQVSFTQNAQAPYAKLLFPRAGDRLSGDFGLFGTAFRYSGCITSCKPVQGLLLLINGQPVFYGTLLGGAADRLALSQVVWRDALNRPVNLTWEQLIPGSEPVSLQVAALNIDGKVARSEAVTVSRAGTAATVNIKAVDVSGDAPVDMTFPTPAPASEVELQREVTGANPARTAWFVFREEDGEEFDARRDEETASIVESYPSEDVYPVGLAVVDDAGNTLVDVLHATAYRPAYKGDPTLSRAGSRLAAMGTNVVSGNFYYQTADMSLSGIGLPFELWRRYNSLSYIDESQERSALGLGGWGHSYDYAIFLNKSGRRLFLALPDGHWERFAYVEDANGQNRQWRSMVPGSTYRVVENYDSAADVEGVDEDDDPRLGFVVYDRDQTKLVFNHRYWSNEHGGVFQPTRIEDRSGNKLRIDYDADHRVATITDTLPQARTIEFTYNADGLLSQVKDGTGRSVHYDYNSSGNLESFRDRRGNTWTYSYATFSDETLPATCQREKVLLTGITDPLGNTLVSNDYTFVATDVDTCQGAWRVTAQTDGEGNEWAISYPSATETRVTNPEGQTTSYAINASHMVAQVTDPNGGSTGKAYALDAAELRDRSLPTALTSPRTLQTALSYDGSRQGNPTRITDPANREMSLAWLEDPTHPDCTLEPEICTNKNLIDRLRLPGTSQDYVLDYDGQDRVEQIADPLSRTASYSYNARGQVIERTDPLGRVTGYGYNAQGFLTTVTDALDNDETYGYDAQGRIQTITNRRDYSTSVDYNENDQPTRIVDADLNEIVYTYDEAGNLTDVEDKRGFTTSYTYNGANLPATATRVDGQGNSYTVTYEYDGLLRLRQTINARNYASTRSYTPTAEGERQTVVDAIGDYTLSQYDLDGNLARVERRAADDTLLERVEYDRDELGRVRLETRRLADNTLLSTHYSYNALGEVASIRDPKQITTYLEYDEIGRLTQTRRDAATVDIVYDETSVLPNHRVIVTEPNDNDTVYTYDALDRLISRTDPLGNTWRYEYDDNGNLRYYRDAEDRTTELVYDKLDRLTLVIYPDGSTVDYDHDPNGNITEIADSLGTTTQSFDGLNRLLARTDSFGQTVGYGYDGSSNITAIQYPGSRGVSYGYDPVDRMTSVEDWLGNQTGFSYDAAGRLTGISHGNGTRVALGYDTAGRLTGYANRRSDNSIIASHQYTLDANGNPIAADVTEPLVPPLATAAQSFDYDTANRLLNTPEGSVQHDPDGNLTVEHRGATQIQYNYDDAHRLSGWTDGTDSIIYRYDGNGARMASVENGVETRYVLDVNKGLPDVLARTDATGQVQDYYVYGAAGLISRITPAGDSYVYHFDPTGSTLALSDASESLVNRYAYTPYGQVRRDVAVENPFEFIGRYGVMAEANGLNFMRARFYHPEIARFVSRDPLWGDVTDAQTLNLYGYVGGQPIGRFDADGLSWEEAWEDFKNRANSAAQWSKKKAKQGSALVIGATTNVAAVAYNVMEYGGDVYDSVMASPGLLGLPHPETHTGDMFRRHTTAAEKSTASWYGVAFGDDELVQWGASYLSDNAEQKKIGAANDGGTFVLTNIVSKGKGLLLVLNQGFYLNAYDNLREKSHFCGSGASAFATPEFFSRACQSHDSCYAQGEMSRSKCDFKFYEDMVLACANGNSRGISKPQCEQGAAVYYAAVRTLGSKAWDEARKK